MYVRDSGLPRSRGVGGYFSLPPFMYQSVYVCSGQIAKVVEH